MAVIVEPRIPRSHALRGNAFLDAPRPDRFQAAMRGKTTQSVEDGIPTRSVGTRSKVHCSHRFMANSTVLRLGPPSLPQRPQPDRPTGPGLPWPCVTEPGTVWGHVLWVTALRTLGFGATYFGPRACSLWVNGVLPLGYGAATFRPRGCYLSAAGLLPFGRGAATFRPRIFCQNSLQIPDTNRFMRAALFARLINYADEGTTPTRRVVMLLIESYK